MKLFLSIFIVSRILSCCYSDTEIHGNYFGRGVCSVYRRDEKVVQVEEIHYQNETTWEWCWHFPPWCTVIDHVSISKSPSSIDIPHEHLKLKCCLGYRSNVQATACIPICSPFCRKGYCTDVDNCTLCVSGYDGPQCDRNLTVSSSRSVESLIPNKLPVIVCNCTDDNYVCTSEGLCICAPGFNGTDCSTVIDPDAFIIDPGEHPSCMSYIVRVTVFLALLVLCSIFVLAYIKRRYNIVQFRPLLDDSAPSTSRKYSST